MLTEENNWVPYINILLVVLDSLTNGKHAWMAHAAVKAEYIH